MQEYGMSTPVDVAVNKIIREFFDYQDKETRTCLLNLNESDKNDMIQSLTSRLYDNIVEKVDDIDFGDIPNTKGDITKLQQLSKIQECLSIVEGLLDQYKQDPKTVNIIKESIGNMITHREIFVRGYLYNAELPIILYNSIVLAIVGSTSLLISAIIDFIKEPGGLDFALTIDKVGAEKTRHSLLLENLEKFNETCRKGHIKALETILNSNRKNFIGGVEIGVLALTGAGIAILFNIIPIIRELIFFFYFTKLRISDYCNLQADLLQINANNLEQKHIKTDAKVKDVSKKQIRVAAQFRKAADFLGMKNKDCENKVNKSIKEDDKKMKAKDVFDKAPDGMPVRDNAETKSSSLF